MRVEPPRSVESVNSSILRLSSSSTTTVLMGVAGGVCCARAALTRSTRNTTVSLIMTFGKEEQLRRERLDPT